MKAPEIRNWKRFFRKIYSETPIFTKYILAQQMQKVKEHFVFFRYFYTVFFQEKTGIAAPASAVDKGSLFSLISNNLYWFFYTDSVW